ncbi:hypothetical protein ACIA8R_01215 [Nonomuraea sp. NPDC051191]|uniref:hypothetical protein n=1 Tax=Nonomuraea sp. NPDC051191 TaxID=3364372 RepID=UPI00379C6E4A
MNDPYGTTRPIPRHAAPPPRHAAPHPPQPVQPGGQDKSGQDGQGLFREEALRHRAMSRVTRMPLVISTPSFLALWLLAAVLLVIGILLTMVAVEAVA